MHQSLCSTDFYSHILRQARQCRRNQAEIPHHLSQLLKPFMPVLPSSFSRSQHTNTLYNSFFWYPLPNFRSTGSSKQISLGKQRRTKFFLCCHWGMQQDKQRIMYCNLCLPFALIYYHIGLNRCALRVFCMCPESVLNTIDYRFSLSLKKKKVIKTIWLVKTSCTNDQLISSTLA